MGILSGRRGIFHKYAPRKYPFRKSKKILIIKLNKNLVSMNGNFLPRRLLMKIPHENFSTPRFCCLGRA